MHSVVTHIKALESLGGGGAPAQKHDAALARVCNSLEDLRRELLPATPIVAVGFMRTDRQAGIEQENALVGPGHEVSALWSSDRQAHTAYPWPGVRNVG